MSYDSLSDYRKDRNQQQQQQQQQQFADPDHTEAVAPVEISRFGVEPPTYRSPQASRESVRTSSTDEEAPGPAVGAAAAAGGGGTVAFKTGGYISGGGGGSGVQPKTQENRQYRQPATSSYEMEQRRSAQMQQTHQRQDEEPQGCSCCECFLKVLSGLLVLLTFPFSLCVCIKIVQQYERAVIFRLGRIQGEPKGPGLFFVLACIDKIRVIDLRTITFDVPPQEILTKDSVTVAVDAVVYYRIFDPIKATVDIEDVHRATRLLAQTTLRNILGTKTLHEILGEREIIAQAMQGSLDIGTDPWGVKVERVEVKDVRLPVQMQRAMAAEAEALREAKAKVIAAEGEQKASRSLKEAADVINESPSALQLRYLQTLNTIAAEKNSTIIFPLPIELLKGMSKK